MKSIKLNWPEGRNICMINKWYYKQFVWKGDAYTNDERQSDYIGKNSRVANFFFFLNQKRGAAKDCYLKIL